MRKLEHAAYLCKRKVERQRSASASRAAAAQRQLTRLAAHNNFLAQKLEVIFRGRYKYTGACTILLYVFPSTARKCTVCTGHRCTVNAHANRVLLQTLNQRYVSQHENIETHRSEEARTQRALIPPPPPSDGVLAAQESTRSDGGSRAYANATHPLRSTTPGRASRTLTGPLRPAGASTPEESTALLPERRRLPSVRPPRQPLPPIRYKLVSDIRSICCFSSSALPNFLL